MKRPLTFVGFVYLLSTACGPTAGQTARLTADTPLNRFCLGGCPTGKPDNERIHHHILTLSNNPRTKFADWVAYEVHAKNFGKSRDRQWRIDPSLNPSNTLEPEDYYGAFQTLKTDRGHQAPLASFSATPYWYETNYLSNITPQKSQLNQGPWKKLEARVRSLARLYEESLFVLTGPAYANVKEKLPSADETHEIPAQFWKVVALVEGSEVAMSSFMFEQHTPRSTPLCAGLVDLATIEEVTELDFPRIWHEAPDSLNRDFGCDSLSD